MKCKNTRYDHECHPIYAAKYDGYCLNCANAGVPDLDGQIADLRAQVFGHCGTAVSDALTGRDEAHLRNCARDDVWLARVALAEIDRLRAELANRDRQLAELREACQPIAAAAKEERHYRHTTEGGVVTEDWIGIDRWLLDALAALLSPTTKGEQP